jgi:hypothetical protein
MDMVLLVDHHILQATNKPGLIVLHHHIHAQHVRALELSGAKKMKAKQTNQLEEILAASHNGQCSHGAFYMKPMEFKKAILAWVEEEIIKAKVNGAKEYNQLLETRHLDAPIGTPSSYASGILYQYIDSQRAKLKEVE